MLKKINIGDRVQWIDQPWSGLVQDICGARASILVDDGFLESALLSHLILLEERDFSLDDVYFQEKNQPKHVAIRPLRTEELDLHIENLFLHWRTIPVEQILERQLQAFKEEFQSCPRQKIDELIVIHGKGSGILKRNLQEILNGYSHISYEEMKYGKYRQAAIKIYFCKPQ